MVRVTEGDRIYGKPGEPMARVTPVARATGYTGAVAQDQVTWSCKHIHATRSGALACAADFSRRCPQCEGCIDDKGNCQGNQILGQVTPTKILQLVSRKDKAKAGRAMGAMMQMKKLDIAKLKAAYEGRA